MGVSGAQQANYFLGLLGELIQRMDDASTGVTISAPVPAPRDNDGESLSDDESPYAFFHIVFSDRAA